MDNQENNIHRLALHLKSIRVEHRLSLQELADKTQISRSTLSRIENAEVSPSAETLGILASAYALSISQLLIPMETRFTPLIKRNEQEIWIDEESGLRRRSISPPHPNLEMEMIQCEISPHTRIHYKNPAFPGHEHQLYMLSGELTLIIDQTSYSLHEGDCLRYMLEGTSTFITGEADAIYIIALS